MAAAARTVSTAAMAMLLALAAGAPACAQDLAGKAALCDACHGEKGIPRDPMMPVIWGQHQAYLDRQIGEFKLGNRQNEAMLSLIRNMPQEEITALAEHFSQKPWPKLNQPRASEAESKRAQAAMVTGQCVACHGILGMGDGTNPRIAGQSRGYMLKTLQDFQGKARGNNPWMSDILGPLHADDLVALAAFMAGR
jgi:cytochrome c553